MGRTKKNIQLKIPEKPRKIKGFRLGGYPIATTISSQPRYDHFDNPPCIFPSAFNSKNFWREKQERTLKNIRFLILKTLLYQGFPADETTKQP